jgi:hypothetical protein
MVFKVLLRFMLCIRPTRDQDIRATIRCQKSGRAAMPCKTAISQAQIEISFVEVNRSWREMTTDKFSVYGTCEGNLDHDLQELGFWREDAKFQSGPISYNVKFHIF